MLFRSVGGPLVGAILSEDWVEEVESLAEAARGRALKRELKRELNGLRLTEEKETYRHLRGHDPSP